jgi:capsular exopolysaccharide synthesis family protein
VDLSQYLKGIGRRWKTIAACVLIALAVGWVLSPTEPVEAGPSTTTYRATTYLLAATGGDLRAGAGTSMETVATLATLGDVPERVAAAIDYDGTPQALAATVSVEPDETTQLLTIAATADSAPRARLVADTFADELLGFLSERTEERVQELKQQLDRLDKRIARLTAQLPATVQTGTTSTRDETTVDPELTPEEAEEQARLQAELDQLEFERQFTQTEYSQLASSNGGNLAGFDVIQEAVATPTAADDGIQAPQSRSIRLAIAAAIGLLLGIALALVLERFDTRLRAKAATEEAYGLPVLAVIPTIGRRRRGAVVADAAPRSAAANAFRLLEAALQLGRQDGPAHAAGNGKGGSPTTILVTSGEPREGKSTIVANVAAMFAEVGRRVIVVCCDYRHPTLHAMLGVDHEPGLTEALERDDADLEALVQESSTPGVRVLATGAVPARQGSVFGSDRTRRLLAWLHANADVVLIDTAPVLAASDWTQLIPQVDAVVLVARAGKTDAGSARRTGEVLQLLQAPVVGVVLNAVPRGLVRKAVDRSWYRYHAPERRRGRSTSGGARTVPRSASEVVLADEVEASNGERVAAATSDEGIPHLARPGRED